MSFVFTRRLVLICGFEEAYRESGRHGLGRAMVHAYAFYTLLGVYRLGILCLFFIMCTVESVN